MPLELRKAQISKRWIIAPVRPAEGIVIVRKLINQLRPSRRVLSQNTTLKGLQAECHEKPVAVQHWGTSGAVSVACPYLARRFCSCRRDYPDGRDGRVWQRPRAGSGDHEPIPGS